jgi:hypothetical protein
MLDKHACFGEGLRAAHPPAKSLQGLRNIRTTSALDRLLTNPEWENDELLLERQIISSLSCDARLSDSRMRASIFLLWTAPLAQSALLESSTQFIARAVGRPRRLLLAFAGTERRRVRA